MKRHDWMGNAAGREPEHLDDNHLRRQRYAAYEIYGVHDFSAGYERTTDFYASQFLLVGRLPDGREDVISLVPWRNWAEKDLFSLTGITAGGREVIPATEQGVAPGTHPKRFVAFEICEYRDGVALFGKLPDGRAEEIMEVEWRSWAESVLFSITGIEARGRDVIVISEQGRGRELEGPEL